jgi:hypothetical protein
MNPPMPKEDVRVVIVLRGRESRSQGEGPQHVGVLEATYLNANTEVHLMNVREKQKGLSLIGIRRKETYRAEAVCGESRTHGFNGGDGETV